MAVNFLHGVETIELKIGPRVVRVVKSSVIGLLGLSMYGPRQELTLVQSSTDAAQFGPLNVSVGNIPSTLDIIMQQGGALCVVVNVFDPTKHLVSDDETIVYQTGKSKINPFTELGVLPYNNATYFNIENVTQEVDLVMGTDYTLTNDGLIEFISTTNVANNDELKIAYNTANYALVTDNEWVGTVTGIVKTGSKLYENCYQSFGFTPKIWISPSVGVSSLETSKAMADLLLGLADKYRGHALIDGDNTGSVQSAISDRGNVATSFGTSSKRAVLLYPVLKPSANTYGDDIMPYSAYFAGVMAKTDTDQGYWVSPSNKEIKGIVGSAPLISAAVNDPLTEANLLNENGIVTVFNSFGTGLRTWGNRSAAFPTSTSPDNFICVQRTADIIHESLELAMLQFIDRPINNALIDSIKDTVNGFLNDLVMRGAIIDGVCTFDPDKNTTTVIGAGQLIFDITFMPPTPAERITFESFIDIQMLQSLIGTNA